jgi:hypothetical protein
MLKVRVAGCYWLTCLAPGIWRRHTARMWLRRHPIIYVLLVAAIAVYFISPVISRPWHGEPEQWLGVFWSALALIIVGSWAFRFRRDGTRALQVFQSEQRPISHTQKRNSVIALVVIAVILFVVFSLLQPK